MTQKLSSSSLLVIDKLEELGQMQALVSTENKFERLSIAIRAGVGQQPQEALLEQLINIKYMRLEELAISMEMCCISDRHVLLIAEGLEKNKQMKSLALSFWK